MEANVDTALKLADVNNDGYITWAEYQEALHREQTTQQPPEHHDDDAKLKTEQSINEGHQASENISSTPTHTEI